MTRRPSRSTRSTPPDLVYQLKIVLRESQPPVWRRIQVPAAMPLNRLHRTLQVAMGWTDAHLHEFAIAGRRYREPHDEDDSPDIVNERTVTLRHVAPGERGQFSYLYDFGDGWEHEVLIERIMAPEAGARYPVCLAGERHCPPEDCGGIPGYEEFLEAIRDSNHPQHTEMLDWVGGRFDRDAFTPDAVNRALRRVR
jgi:hypothetical protein